jgi:hypothetical protein
MPHVHFMRRSCGQCLPLTAMTSAPTRKKGLLGAGKLFDIGRKSASTTTTAQPTPSHSSESLVARNENSSSLEAIRSTSSKLSLPSIFRRGGKRTSTSARPTPSHSSESLVVRDVELSAGLPIDEPSSEATRASDIDIPDSSASYRSTEAESPPVVVPTRTSLEDGSSAPQSLRQDAYAIVVPSLTGPNTTTGPWKSIADSGWTIFKDVIKAMKEVSSVFPPLEGAVNGFCAVLDRIEVRMHWW